MTVAIVKGNGIEIADFVCITVFNAANGDANIATQNITAVLPTQTADASNGDLDDVDDEEVVVVMEEDMKRKIPVNTMTDNTTWTCNLIDPGKLGDWDGQYCKKFQQ